MLFDWFTIFAQLVNFLILMWLLKKFLYKPVLDAIDARENRISSMLKETQASEAKAAAQQVSLTQKNAAFESEKLALLEQAKTNVATQQKQWLDEASATVASTQAQWISALQNEQRELNQSINQRTSSEVVNVARKALADLSDAELEMQIVKVLIRQVDTMTPAQRKQFGQTVQGPQNELLIRSAFTFTPDQQHYLQEAMQRLLQEYEHERDQEQERYQEQEAEQERDQKQDEELERKLERKKEQISLKFVVEPALIGGIEMVGNGHKLSWNIAAYLSDLDISIKRLIDSKSRVGQEQPNDKT